MTPTPTARLMAMMNLLRRLCKSMLPARAIPEAKTLANKKIVIPPRTQSGMLVMTPAILLRTPNKINQNPHAYPARRAAHLVKAITPLFWENVVFGKVVHRPDKMEHMASANRPP